MHKPTTKQRVAYRHIKNVLMTYWDHHPQDDPRTTDEYHALFDALFVISSDLFSAKYLLQIPGILQQKCSGCQATDMRQCAGAWYATCYFVATHILCRRHGFQLYSDASHEDCPEGAPQ